MIADKLFEKVEKNGVVCVGLDTSLDYIPEEFKSKFSNESDMLFAFNNGMEFYGDVVVTIKNGKIVYKGEF